METDTFFAPAQRSSAEQLKSEIAVISSSVVVESLLYSLSGLLAVINKNRQITAVNLAFMKELGITDISQILGARLGETLHCVHAHETAGGCGTSRFCSTCGAVNAMMKSLTEGVKCETLCALTAQKEGKEFDSAFRIQTTPMTIENEPFILMFLQDVSREQEWKALEEVFFHDFNNLLGGMIGSLDLLKMGAFDDDCLDMLRTCAFRMKQEIDVQKVLFQKSADEYVCQNRTIAVNELFEELRAMIMHNMRCADRVITFTCGEETVTTDPVLVQRILLNLILNGVEASNAEEPVTIACRYDSGSVLFSVHNDRAIPADLQKRIFQRYFSTKALTGRGLGTYSIKLFGEKYLGGEVWFTSSEEHGTTFNLRLPAEPRS